MAEIKSTLDIIMEKTRGMTLSDEEKKELEEREIRGKVHGWLQRCMDGLVDPEELEKQLEQLKPAMRPWAAGMIVEAALERVDPREENGRLIEVIQTVGRKDTQPLKAMIDACGHDLSKRREERRRALLESLGQAGIRGSAVIPNVEADSVWQSTEEALLADFRKKAREALG